MMESNLINFTSSEKRVRVRAKQAVIIQAYRGGGVNRDLLE